jgi:cytoskeleton protein RodZ
MQQENLLDEVVADGVAVDGTGETAGQRLRAAREAAGMSVADIAQALKFSARQVEALEADDHSALPGNTIVRGFARSYARLVGLKAEDVLGLLNTEIPHQPAEVRPPDNMGLAGEPGGLRQISPIMSVTIVVALAALMIAVWQYLMPGVSKPGAVNGDVSVAAQPNASPLVAPPQERTVPPAQGDAAVTGQLGQAVPAQIDASSQPAAAPVLLFVFSGRSWLEVTDAAKQTLHTGESPAGSRLTLTGQPPFDIVIGNASQVKFSYGEREIDLAPHTRADVARLKVE